jgi:hypothetical protein
MAGASYRQEPLAAMKVTALTPVLHVSGIGDREDGD